MNVTKYEYSCPTNRGYIKFKLTKKQHKKLFPKRKRNAFFKYEYYHHDRLEKIIIEKYTSILGKFIITVTSPIMLLVAGLGNIGEFKDDLYRVFNERFTGTFMRDFIDGNKYHEVMDEIK